MSSKFYTSVERYGNNILWRGYENGRPFSRKVQYEPRMFETSYASNSGFISLDLKKPLMERKFPSMKECKAFIDKYTGSNKQIYGNTNYIAQFIHDHYPNDIKFDVSKINMFMFDIEVDISTGKPNMRTADKPITAVSIKSSRHDEYILLGLKDYDKTKTETNIPLDRIRFIKFDSEVKMLSYFIKLWKHEYPEIVSGWNSVYFDIQYIMTRIERLFGEDTLKSMSPWGIVKPISQEMYGKEQWTYHIYGINSIDYMDAFKKFGYKYGPQETYKLDHVANVILGERKLSYEEYGSLSELYVKNPQKYLDYALKDTQLIQRFEEETALLALVLTVAYEGGVNYKDAFGTVGIWDAILYRRLMNNKEVPPVKGAAGTPSNDLVGGFVKEPRPGLYKWIVSFDLNSLYPHLMMQYNMSPETINKAYTLIHIKNDILANLSLDKNKEHAEAVKEFLDCGKYDVIFYNITEKFLDVDTPKDDLVMFGLANSMHTNSIAANGTTFTNTFEGLIPKIIDEKYAERSIAKNSMLEKEKLLEKTDDEKQRLLIKKDIIQLHNKQMSIKILMNALYGATANPYFIYYIMEMAEAITKSGQLSVQWAAKYVNAYMNKICKTTGVDYITYIDTDSIYINFEAFIVKMFGTSDIDNDTGEKFIDDVCKSKIEGVIKDAYTDLANYLGSYKNRMVMKREKINNTALFVRKKRYVLSTLNSEGVHYSEPKISVTGLESVRASTPEVCRERLKNSFKIVMTTDEATTQQYIDKFYEEFVKLPAEKIAKNSGTDNINKYADDSESVSIVDGLYDEEDELNYAEPTNYGSFNISKFSDGRGGYIKGTPGHVRGCLVYNTYLKKLGLDTKYNLIQSGDKIKTVYLKMPNPLKENLVSFPEILPKEMGLDAYIDYETQFFKVFLSPMEKLLNSIGWKAVKIDNILDMFDDE